MTRVLGGEDTSFLDHCLYKWNRLTAEVGEVGDLLLWKHQVMACCFGEFVCTIKSRSLTPEVARGERKDL